MVFPHTVNNVVGGAKPFSASMFDDESCRTAVFIPS
jgi:hypothetical protein